MHVLNFNSQQSGLLTLSSNLFELKFGNFIQFDYSVKKIKTGKPILDFYDIILKKNSISMCMTYPAFWIHLPVLPNKVSTKV